MMKRRETEWRRKEIKRMQRQQAMMKRKQPKHFNSSNLQGIIDALKNEEK